MRDGQARVSRLQAFCLSYRNLLLINFAHESDQCCVAFPFFWFTAIFSFGSYSRTTRKPTSVQSEYHQTLLGDCGSVISQSSSRVWSRAAQRRSAASERYEPPRTTCSVPESGPRGSVTPSCRFA